MDTENKDTEDSTSEQAAEAAQAAHDRPEVAEQALGRDQAHGAEQDQDQGEDQDQDQDQGEDQDQDQGQDQDQDQDHDDDQGQAQVHDQDRDDDHDQVQVHDQDRDRDQGRDRQASQEPIAELHRLVELATKYPEIGPPLADLAFKIGQPEFANRIVRMGLGGDTPGLEFYFVAANAARREQRTEDAFRFSLDAVRAFAAATDEALAPDDGQRLLHLVRLGFATLMFDVADVHGNPDFVNAIAEELPKLENRLGSDPFFRSLLAQAYWFQDKERSEREWDRADELGDAELTWNARGTWYKEAERDLDKAERAYRQGLEKAPGSALLRHNIAQILLGKAELPEVDLDMARRLLREAEDFLRAALREECPRGLRRHVHATRDRLHELRASFPPPGSGPAADTGPRRTDREPAVGDVIRGRVSSVTSYGAFVSVGGGQIGLLHKSELSHGYVDNPATVVKVGDEIEVKVLEVQRKEGERRPRIGLSRKALLAPPPGGETAGGAEAAPRRSDRGPGDGRGRQGKRGGKRAPRGDRRGRGGDRGERGDRMDRPERREPRRGGRQDAADRVKEQKIASLGEMLLAKMEEQKNKKG